MLAKIILTAAQLLAALTLTRSHEFLKEKPDFLKTCDRQSAEFSNCLGSAFQHIFSDWKNGVPGASESRSIDPMFVKNFDVVEDGSNVTPITVKLQNITVLGMSTAQVQNISMKEKEYSFRMTYSIPRIRMRGHYTALGQVLLLKIDTNGDMFMDIENGVYTVVTRVKLADHHDIKFFDLTGLRFTVNSIEQLSFNFSNLFRDPALTANTNDIFNQRWRLLFDVFRPNIEKEINSVLLAHFRSVFSAVPANFFIADVDNDS